ncbi:methylated-DNA--[protein]-cysteine S-methyltransferase [Marinobacter zhanjiangensis]|uniref:Methylated-DNA--protein-cysteine methyltransferase n=1 Tax=Marinobacter zhanjiangensis TaxID=578215 RepID=A0ABQ3AQQ3_9GAMM|nr:methylated-DNA--[protein]-cysteine S-methyltransferase [Marinobacter zhanjiangensis]GGY62629.1 methylated-DNA--protein-cysteine methyltransferase [Marinobacter zhanjiangensis]
MHPQTGTVYYTELDSPIGTLLITGDGVAITGLHMEQQATRPTIGDDWLRDDQCFREALEQLTAYFRGERQQFDLPLAGAGTRFQKTVWAALQEIPYGQTQTYGQLARRIGNQNASRAVGLANGRNPIGIIVPCHRVIGANGSLTGYAGGVERKQWLLAHEQAHMDR